MGNQRETGGADWPQALDAMAAAAAQHRVLLENEHVRVLETTIRAGETTPVHTHRWPSVQHVVSWSHFVRRDDVGTVLVDSRLLASPPGEGATLWSPPLGPHSVENVGDGDLRVIAIELKGVAAA